MNYNITRSQHGWQQQNTVISRKAKLAKQDVQEGLKKNTPRFSLLVLHCHRTEQVGEKHYKNRETCVMVDPPFQLMTAVGKSNPQRVLQKQSPYPHISNVQEN